MAPGNSLAAMFQIQMAPLAQELESAFTKDDFFAGAAPAALPGFCIETEAKLFGCFNGPGVGSGGDIAQGTPLLANRGLCEYRAQFHLSDVGWHITVFPLPAFGFGAYYRNTCAIHFDV